MKSNPFFELYVGDRISAHEFVTVFSPLLVEHTEALFLPGNIVVTGIQGCGKSMLLSLLKPKVRMEFDTAREVFPVREDLRRFICGSVNLAHQNVIDFGYRSAIDADVLQTELQFADFLNYLLCDSILSSIEQYLVAPDHIRSEVGLLGEKVDFDQFALEMANQPIWEGWLGRCESFAQLRSRLGDRARAYRRFLHGKDRELDHSIRDTITAIGSPQIVLAELLRVGGWIDSRTHVFADIDQYEELGSISSRQTAGEAVDYRAVINKALSSRNGEISYRIGTRGYSWKSHGKIHGTSGNLEQMRDYKYIDLDDILRKHEDDSSRAGHVFDRFAVDVFARRLRFSGFDVPKGHEAKKFEEVYGRNLSPEEKVNQHLGIREKASYVKVEDGWSETTKSSLRSLAERNFYQAKLGELWVRQKGDVDNLSVRDELLPWRRSSSQWWRKERAHAMVVRIASETKQKTIWGGASELLELSGGSILAFLGLNQFIWSTLIQRNDRPEIGLGEVPTVPVSVQSVSILKASKAWVEMIYEQSGRSAERARFVTNVGSILRKKLLDDKNLSYPGANGFSLLDRDLDEFPEVRAFLEELADYGNVLMLPHTSKSSDRKLRTKFYFHPIFCPSLGLPYVRTKEPYYAKIGEVAGWIYESGYEVPLRSSSPEVQKGLI